jgi:hypothetical protein
LGWSRHGFLSLDHFRDDALKRLQPGAGNDDGAAITFRIFSDTQKFAPRIFLQGDYELLALNLHRLVFECVLFNHVTGSMVIRICAGWLYPLVGIWVWLAGSW